MKSEFRPATIYEYPHHSIDNAGRCYIVMSPSVAWDYENSVLLRRFDESNCIKHPGIVTLKFS